MSLEDLDPQVTETLKSLHLDDEPASVSEADIQQANALAGLADTYCAQSRNRAAEKAFMEAHEIYTRIGSDLGTANALLGLGNTYHAQSKNAEAENALNDAHKIYSRIGDSLGTGNALRSLALLSSNQNRYDAADSE